MPKFKVTGYIATVFETVVEAADKADATDLVRGLGPEDMDTYRVDEVVVESCKKD